MVHGLSIPFAKAGYHLPRTISAAISTSTTAELEPVPLASNLPTHSTATPHGNAEATSRRTRRHDTETVPATAATTPGSDSDSVSKSGQLPRHTHPYSRPPGPVAFQIGRGVARTMSPSSEARLGSGGGEEPSRPVNLVLRTGTADGEDADGMRSA